MARASASILVEQTLEEPSSRELDRPSIFYFPFGAPDERIDSRVGRYHHLEGHRGVDMTYRRLFDSLPFLLSQPVPSRLSKLAVKFPGELTSNVEELYHRSTLLPLFEQFGGERFHTKERNTLLHSLSSFSHAARANVATTSLCIQCLLNDEEQFGWPYIRRSHNVPGVTACWRHEIPLISSCADCGCPFQPPKSLSLVPWRGCVSCGLLPGKSSSVQPQSAPEIEIRYAKFAKEVLEASPIRVSSAELGNLYRHQALARGFGKKSLVDRVTLLKAYEETFGLAMIRRIDAEHESFTSDAWYHVMGRGRQTGEVPIWRHLLVSLFLFEDAESFITKLRLVAAGEFAQVSDGKARRRGQKGDFQVLEHPAKNDLLEDIAAFANAEGIDIDGLWKVRYGDMKRLIRKQPDAIKKLQERIKKLATYRGRSASRLSSSQKPLNPKDEEWAKIISEVAPPLYASDDIPRKVSGNALSKAAAILKFVDVASSPLAHAALKQNAESGWHFYARRLLWNARHLNGKPLTAGNFSAGMNYYQMKEVLHFIVEKLGDPCNAEKPICETLASIGIDRHWEGPCPGQEVRRTGRAYKKITRR